VFQQTVTTSTPESHEERGEGGKKAVEKKRREGNRRQAWTRNPVLPVVTVWLGKKREEKDHA